MIKKKGMPITGTNTAMKPRPGVLANQADTSADLQKRLKKSPQPFTAKGGAATLPTKSGASGGISTMEPAPPWQAATVPRARRSRARDRARRSARRERFRQGSRRRRMRVSTVKVETVSPSPDLQLRVTVLEQQVSMLAGLIRNFSTWSPGGLKNSQHWHELWEEFDIIGRNP